MELLHRVQTWFELTPVDTLFFRGGELMEAGIHHDTGEPIFPPVTFTAVGAFVTWLLGSANPKKKNRLRVLGPLLKVKLEEEGKNDKSYQLLYPIPLNVELFIETGNNVKVLKKEALFSRVFFGSNFPRVFVDSQSRTEKFCFRKGGCDFDFLFNGKVTRLKLRPLSYWVNFSFLKKVFDENVEHFECRRTESIKDIGVGPVIVPSSFLYFEERRIGIALELKTRTARESHLFSAKHIRLAPFVSLVFGINRKPEDLSDEGYLQFGGEKRICRAVKFSGQEEWKNIYAKGGGNQTKVKYVYAVSWVPEKDACQRYNEIAVPFTGKRLKVGGWSMKERFHRKTISYLPPGTVFCIYDEEPKDLKDLKKMLLMETFLCSKKTVGGRKA